MFSKSFILSFVGSLLVTFTVCGGTSALEGVVKDPSGRPVKGADVRIEAKNFSKVVKTDANGRYVCNGLGVATYKATLVISGQVKASIANAKTEAGKPTQLNFKLTGKVDEKGNVVNDTGFSNVETTRGPAVQQTVIRVSGVH
ncbi:MAG: hypothetical protein DMF10_03915 [Verrucomicrobia bacterium]|nr:MAG: hypothetical protein DMF10_03915 [Verrucomicrobiota bacterium]